MSLLIDIHSTGFDQSTIHRGDLIRAKYQNWREPCNGIVAYVTATRVRVLYLTTTGYVSNFYSIHLQDVLDGLWEIQWGCDFEHSARHPAKTEAVDDDF